MRATETTTRRFMNLATNLRRMRKDKKMTQEHLAEKALLSRNTIIGIETMRYSTIELGTLVKIAEVLGVKEYELLRDV